MNELLFFGVGILTGVAGTLVVGHFLSRRGGEVPELPADSRPHVDAQAAQKIGQDKGIEVFDD